jgi:hypothetical protein
MIEGAGFGIYIINQDKIKDQVEVKAKFGHIIIDN